MKPKRKEGCRGGGEVKPDYLLKPEVTNLPNARDAKVNTALEKEMEKEKEETSRPLVTSANNGGIFGGLPNANHALPSNARRFSSQATSLIFTPA